MRIHPHPRSGFGWGFLHIKKPQQEFWSVVYKQIGVPKKSEIVVWDDDQENIESAKNFGFVSEVYSDFDSYESRMKSLVG